MTREKAIECLDDMKVKIKIPKAAVQARENNEALDMAIKALKQEPNTWSLDDAREDFMHDVYNTLDFLPTNNEANRIIDSFDRVTKCIEQESCGDAVSRKDIYFKLTNGAYPNESIEQFVDRLVKELKSLPPVQPKYNTSEWCHDCSEYDQDKHSCPRFNRVIRNAVKEVKKPKTGHWFYDKSIDNWRCSECNETPKTMGYCGSANFMAKHFKFCNHCGARMIEPHKSEG